MASLQANPQTIWLFVLRLRTAYRINKYNVVSKWDVSVKILRRGMTILRLGVL